MSETLARLNPNCTGCTTLNFCVAAFDRAAEEVGGYARQLESHKAAQAAGEYSEVSPERAAILAELVLAGAASLGHDKDKIAAEVATCPGQPSPGECGKGPGAQLDMVPGTAELDFDDPVLQEIFLAALEVGRGHRS